MGRRTEASGRLKGTGLLLALMFFGPASACGPARSAEQRDTCVGPADAGAGCVAPGTARSDPGGTGGTGSSSGTDDPVDGGGADALPVEIMMLPCAVCARADNCCKARGEGGCGYTAACSSAHTTDEQQLRVAVCLAVVGPDGPAGVPRCGRR
jgi:hypothetical protein